MTEPVDYADREVKGLARYIPTTLSRGILLLLPGTTWLLFSSIREHPEWFRIQSLSPLEQTLSAALVSTIHAWFFILVLFIDMTLAIHQSKHRRIIHYTNEHPLMSFRFLVANATISHWLALGFISAAFFALGYGYANIP